MSEVLEKIRKKNLSVVLQDKLNHLMEWENMDFPSIRFKSDWEVTIFPNFAGSSARFVVHENGNHVSVYLDMHQNLGEDINYWEVYPGDQNGDPVRVPSNNADDLLKTIEKGLTFKTIKDEK